MKLLPICVLFFAASSAAPYGGNNSGVNIPDLPVGIDTRVTGSLVGSFSRMSLVALDRTVGKITSGLSGSLKQIANNIYLIQNTFGQLDTIALGASIPHIVDQISMTIDELFRAINESFETLYETLGSSGESAQGVISQVFQTTQRLFHALTSTEEESTDIIVKTIVNLGFSIKQLFTSVHEITEEIAENIDEVSSDVKEAVNALVVGVAQVLYMIVFVVDKTDLYTNYHSTDLQKTLYELTQTVTTVSEMATEIINDTITKSLKAADDATSGLIKNIHDFPSKLEAIIDILSSNLNTLLTDLSLDINEIAAQYQSVDLASIVGKFFDLFAIIISGGYGFAEYAETHISEVFSKSFSKVLVKSSALLNYIANISVSDVAKDALETTKDKISSLIESLMKQVSEATDILSNENGDFQATVDSIRLRNENTADLVDELISNLTESADLDAVLVDFFEKLVKNTSNHLEYYKDHPTSFY